MSKPWRPNIEREPEFNPFVNSQDHESETPPPPLEDTESDATDSAQKPARVDKASALRVGLI